MIVIRVSILLIFLCMTIMSLLTENAMAVDNKFIVLCYHAVTSKPRPNDPYTIPSHIFVKQMEYLKTHGFNPVSLDDILRAKKGDKLLPDKAVLLMFDDGYISYKDFVLPVLKKYGYPSVLAVVGNFVGYKPKNMPEPLMTWQQIREVASNKLVEIASHSYDLHKAVRYTQQNNVAAAVDVKIFDPDKNIHETPDDYSKRMEDDFIKQSDLFKKELGYLPKAMVWPYGKYNADNIKASKKFGFQFAFTLENGYASLDNLFSIKRNMVLNEPLDEFSKSLKTEFAPMKEFIKIVNNPLYEEKEKIIRAIQVDLDLIYDPDPEKFEQNLGKLIDRLVAMRINTVFLQAFADPDGTGTISSVYFPNRVLPVRADIFSYAAHQISIRKIQVFAWLPTLSIQLPDKELNDSLRVKEFSKGSIGLSRSWYMRLTPFSDKVANTVKMLYEDLASSTPIDGVLFQDDAYLNDFEDFHPEAIKKFKERFGSELSFEAVKSNPDILAKWTKFKTETLVSFLSELKERVRYWRPEAKFIRNIYAETVLNPSSEEWYAQNYSLFLKDYDYVVIMAYPQMENASNPVKWLRSLVKTVRKINGVDKTIFKVQTFDWNKKEWIDSKLLHKELRSILLEGGLHLAYYPDDSQANNPDLEKIKLEMSTKTFPYTP